MTVDTTGTSGPARIGELRASIDELDQQIVELLARRTRLVSELTEFKQDEEMVRSQARASQVIERVSALAAGHGMPAGIAEATYRTLIDELTRMQLERLEQRRIGDAGPVGDAGDAGPVGDAGEPG